MEVRFRSRRLQRCFEISAEASRLWGPETGARYVQRVTALLASERVSDLYKVRAFDFDPLTGVRRGQFAIRLNGQMRLILTVDDASSVTVEEVIDYRA